MFYDKHVYDVITFFTFMFLQLSLSHNNFLQLLKKFLFSIQKNVAYSLKEYAHFHSEKFHSQLH